MVQTHPGKQTRTQMAAEAAVTGTTGRDMKGEILVHVEQRTRVTALSSKTPTFAEESQGHNVAAGEKPQEGRSSKLMKGQARLFACSHLHVSVIKLKEDVTEIHWRESQTGIPTGNTGTLKIFWLNPPINPTKYVMLIPRDETPSAQRGRAVAQGHRAKI